MQMVSCHSIITDVKKTGLRCCDGQFCFVYIYLFDIISIDVLPVCTYVCMPSTVCMPNAFEGQKRASSPLEQELQMVVNYHT